MVWSVKNCVVTVATGNLVITWMEVVHLDVLLVRMVLRAKSLVVTVETGNRVMTWTEIVGMDVALGYTAKHVMKVLYR